MEKVLVTVIFGYYSDLNYFIDYLVECGTDYSVKRSVKSVSFLSPSQEAAQKFLDKFDPPLLHDWYNVEFQ